VRGARVEAQVHLVAVLGATRKRMGQMKREVSSLQRATAKHMADTSADMQVLGAALGGLAQRQAQREASRALEAAAMAAEVARLTAALDESRAQSKAALEEHADAVARAAFFRAQMEAEMRELGQALAGASSDLASTREREAAAADLSSRLAEELARASADRDALAARSAELESRGNGLSARLSACEEALVVSRDALHVAEARAAALGALVVDLRIAPSTKRARDEQHGETPEANAYSSRGRTLHAIELTPAVRLPDAAASGGSAGSSGSDVGPVPSLASAADDTSTHHAVTRRRLDFARVDPVGVLTQWDRHGAMEVEAALINTSAFSGHGGDGGEGPATDAGTRGSEGQDAGATLLERLDRLRGEWEMLLERADMRG
jgi:hypothetical protein